MKEVQEERKGRGLVTFAKVVFWIQLFFLFIVGILLIKVLVFSKDKWDISILVVFAIVDIIYFFIIPSCILGIILSTIILIRKVNRKWGLILLITSIIIFLSLISFYLVLQKDTRESQATYEKEQIMRIIEMEECYRNFSNRFSSPQKIVDVKFFTDSTLSSEGSGILYLEGDFFVDFLRDGNSKNEENISTEEKAKLSRLRLDPSKVIYASPSKSKAWEFRRRQNPWIIVIYRKELFTQVEYLLWKLADGINFKDAVEAYIVIYHK